MGRFQEAINSGFDQLPVQVMDKATYDLIQINDVIQAVNSTRTRTGNLILRRSLRQPLTDAASITEKQKSLKELRSDKDLYARVNQFVGQVLKDEEHFFDLYRGNYDPNWPGSSYRVFKGAQRFLFHLANGLKGVVPKSDYLRALTEDFEDLREDDIYGFIKDPICRTIKGIKRFDDIGKKWPEPYIEFKPTDFKTIRMIIVGLPLIGAAALVTPGAILNNADLMMLGVLSETTSLLWTPLMLNLGRRFDDKRFVKPLRDMYFSNPKVVDALESMGRLDELMSLTDYADSLQVPVTLPQVEDAPRHHFEAKDLKNPVLAKKDPSYVGNDVSLDEARLTFLTGPNSGGKTSLSKTILQAQVLAQIGSYIPAESAKIAVADGIYYHSPMVNRLQDDEGRFGVEIARTRDIFYQTTPRSIVVLDELIEATTYKEKIRNSLQIMKDFGVIGGNVVLVTHNHELVEHFKEQGLGQYWQVEFDGDRPTHKIISGISTDSHADQVMERVGFSREDRQKYLREKGYI